MQGKPEGKTYPWIVCWIAIFFYAGVVLAMRFIAPGVANLDYARMILLALPWILGLILLVGGTALVMGCIKTWRGSKRKAVFAAVAAGLPLALCAAMLKAPLLASVAYWKQHDSITGAIVCAEEAVPRFDHQTILRHFSTPDAIRAKEFAGDAMRMLDKGEFSTSIELWKKAAAMDPDNIIYQYEIAYTWNAQKNYQKALCTLRPLVGRVDEVDSVYQMLGNVYSDLNKPDLAIATYEEGLKKFPDSGKLYLELGTTHLRLGKPDQAVAFYEKGIARDPQFPSNYYRAAQLFAHSTEKIWAVLYGEVFLNLERNTKRSYDISKLLFDIYSKSISVNSRTKAGVDFSRRAKSFAGERSKEPVPAFFERDFENAMSLATEKAAKAEGKGNLSISAINEIRRAFLDIWFEKGLNSKYPNSLFDWQTTLSEKGFLETYNYWVLNQGDPGEFRKWVSGHEATYDEFVRWFSKNPMNVTTDNYVHRKRTSPATKARMIQLINTLETDPYNERARNDRREVLAWLTDAPDVTVVLCASVLGDKKALIGDDGAALAGQLAFSEAKYLLEHPEKAKDYRAINIAGVEGVLKTYSAMKKAKPGLSIESMDSLARIQANGTLEAFVDQVRCSE